MQCSVQKNISHLPAAGLSLSGGARAQTRVRSWESQMAQKGGPTLVTDFAKESRFCKFCFRSISGPIFSPRASSYLGPPPLSPLTPPRCPPNLTTSELPSHRFLHEAFPDCFWQSWRLILGSSSRPLYTFTTEAVPSLPLLAFRSPTGGAREGWRRLFCNLCIPRPSTYS